jgi:hypothetical protein
MNIVIPETTDELIQLLNAGGCIADWVTNPDETAVAIAVKTKGNKTGRDEGLCQFCGEYLFNWKGNHELNCRMNPSPDEDAIARFKASEKKRHARRGHCSVCGGEFSYGNFGKHKKKHDVLAKFVEIN